MSTLDYAQRAKSIKNKPEVYHHLIALLIVKYICILHLFFVCFFCFVFGQPKIDENNPNQGALC